MLPTARRLMSSAAAGTRFKVLGVQQIAVGASSKSALSKLWCDTFGVRKVGDFESESENVREDILQLGRGVQQRV